MRRFVYLLPALLAACAVAADRPAKPDKNAAAPAAKKVGKALAVGNDVPAPFHPYYVSGPYLNRLRQEDKESKKVVGRFHCPVSHHGLAPLVLLFVRDVTFSPPLKELLRRLDALVEKNPTARLGVVVVFISDDIKDVVTDDETRENLAGKLEDLAGELTLKHVALCLDGPADLEKWELDPQQAYTLVLLRRYKIVATEGLARDGLTPQKVDAIVQEVAEKFGARRR
jgi:hypothetical protein